MLHPQDNRCRRAVSLSGLWRFALDPAERGEGSGWVNGLPADSRWVAVPGSWNEQFQDTRDYLGPAWYETTFMVPAEWTAAGSAIGLRFGSAQYRARAWLNGALLGEHEGGHLPFDLDCSSLVRADAPNRLVVCVDGRLDPNTVPPGGLGAAAGVSFGQTGFPDVNFDFFPYAGLHRPVWLHARPRGGIEDVWVTTDLEGDEGRVTVRVLAPQSPGAAVRVRVAGAGGTAVAELGHAPGEYIMACRPCELPERWPHHGRQSSAPTGQRSEQATLQVALPHVRPWSPEDPYLYTMTVELERDGRAVDEYTLPVGVRTVRVEGQQLLLNGRPINLRGCCKHEDFPVAGRGLFLPVVVKDFELLRWLGANSFRTSHYPYADEVLDLADRLGFLVIAETPAVGLFFGDDGESTRLALCRQQLRELIERDKNHPAVIMWSVANEPHSQYPAAGRFLRALYDDAKQIDPTRPVTLVSCHIPEEVFREAFDVVCLNRYYGWYLLCGRLDEAAEVLAADLDDTFATYGKPIILSEFGADAVAGMHGDPPEMFTEEYQAEMIEAYLQVCAARPWIVGTHIWNFADFKTQQAVHRVIQNRKGLFTRERQPKLAAHTVRRLWRPPA